MKRIAVLVSGGGTNLQALIDAEKEGIIVNGKISLVISNVKGAYALERARMNGIPTAVVLKKECGSQELFEQNIIALLREHEIDLIVLAGFMSILSEEFTKAFPHRIINVQSLSLIAYSVPVSVYADARTFYNCSVRQTTAAVFII